MNRVSGHVWGVINYIFSFFYTNEQISQNIQKHIKNLNNFLCYSTQGTILRLGIIFRFKVASCNYFKPFFRIVFVPYTICLHLFSFLLIIETFACYLVYKGFSFRKNSRNFYDSSNGTLEFYKGRFIHLGQLLTQIEKYHEQKHHHPSSLHYVKCTGGSM